VIVRGMAVPVIARVGAGRGAALAVYPAGVAIFVVLLFPDGYAVFDFVDDVAARAEGFIAVSRAGAHPYGHFADGEVADAMDAGSALYAEAFDGLGDDAFAFFNCERFEGFIFE